MRLIDADALMEVIREHDYPLRSHFNSTDNGMFTLGIQQAVDEAPTIEPVKWISVSERLPKDSEPVYAYRPTGCGSVEATMGMMARAHKYSGYTHWMPRTVPEPPRKDDEA